MLIKQVKTPDKQTDYELDVDTKREFDQTVMDNVNFASSRSSTSEPARRRWASVGHPLARPARPTTTCPPGTWATPAVVDRGDDGQVRQGREHGDAGGTGGLSSVTGGSFPAQMWTAFNRGALEDLPVETFEMPWEWVAGGGSTVSPSRPTSVSRARRACRPTRSRLR